MWKVVESDDGDGDGDEDSDCICEFVDFRSGMTSSYHLGLCFGSSGSARWMAEGLSEGCKLGYCSLREEEEGCRAVEHRE